MKRSLINCFFENLWIYVIGKITCLSYFGNYSLLVITEFVPKMLHNKCFYLWQCYLFSLKNFTKCLHFCSLNKFCKLFIFCWINIWFLYSFLWVLNIKKNCYFLVRCIIRLCELIFILNCKFVCNCFIKWVWEDCFNNCSILLHF